MRISLAVLRRKKNALSSRADIKMNGPTLLRKLETAEAGFRLEGGDGPDHGAQLERLDRMVAAAYDNLQRADDQHFAEIDNDDHLRQARDQATDDLVRVLIDHSITIDRNYGKAGRSRCSASARGSRRSPTPSTTWRGGPRTAWRTANSPSARRPTTGSSSPPNGSRPRSTPPSAASAPPSRSCARSSASSTTRCAGSARRSPSSTASTRSPPTG